MKSFLLSPFKHQAKLFSIVSLLLVMAFYIIIVSASADKWKFEKNNFKPCMIGEVLPDCSTNYPDSLLVYALESNGLALSILPAAFVGLTFALLLLGDFSKRVLISDHSGWNRLSLVVSVLSGAAVAGWWIQEEEDGGRTMMAAIIAICLVGASFVYGRASFLWIAEGFSGQKRATVTPSSLTMACESPPENSSVDHKDGTIFKTAPMRQAEGNAETAASSAYLKSGNKRSWKIPSWAWWVAGISGFALNFAHSGDKAIETLFSSLAQAIGLTIFYGIYLLFRKKK